MQKLLKGHNITGIMDAGASDGRVTRKFLKTFPEATAYLFEPHPIYREKLQQYAKLDERITPQFIALSDTDGELELNLNQQTGMTSIFDTNKLSAELFPKGELSKQPTTVPVKTIDSWRELNGNPPFHIMKFDLQAAELKALQGAHNTLTESTLLIYTEIFFNPLYEGGALFSQIDLLLREYGFNLYNIYKPKASADGMLLWANAIYVNSNKIKL
jgi:FkbM family methyltransferase